MYFDGSLKLGGGGTVVVFISPKGEQLKYIFQILFNVSNNEAEYEALLHGLRLAISLGIKRLLVYSDSLLIVQQIKKERDINKETMDAYVAEIRKLENKFTGLEIHHVVRDNNIAADILSKLGSDRAEVPPGVFVHELHHPSVKTSDQMIVDSDPTDPSREVMMIDIDRRTPIIDLIREQMLPPDIKANRSEAIQLFCRSKSYVLIHDKLYKRGAGTGILMKCVSTEEGNDILQEIHEGSCANHAASRTLVGKAFRSGFYWLTALANVENLVRRCSGYQYFAKQNHMPAHNHINTPPSWPFACWSLDMIGPLPIAPAGFTHILVAVDKFTKWIEYKPVTKISPDRAVDFICDILH